MDTEARDTLIGRCVLAAVVFVTTLTGSAYATEDCTADMANAHARIAEIQARDPKLDAFLKQKNVKAVCAILRNNIVDMTAARDAMTRCVPDGFQKAQDVTALNTNLSALSDAVAAQCH